MATYLGQTTAPSTLDWAIGVIWMLMCIFHILFGLHLINGSSYQEDWSDSLWIGVLALSVSFSLFGGFWAANPVAGSYENTIMRPLIFSGVSLVASLLLLGLLSLLSIVLKMLLGAFFDLFDRPPSVRQSDWLDRQPPARIIFIYAILVFCSIILLPGVILLRLKVQGLVGGWFLWLGEGN
ncbi:hypothetical protein DFH09DRAFT_1291770, partial [Mycena vulgaris]